MMIRHSDCLQEQRKATKEILEFVEREFVEKYDIYPEDYHRFRALVKSKIFRISNRWHMFFARVVDVKFEKKVNETGELKTTHLKNGDDKL